MCTYTVGIGCAMVGKWIATFWPVIYVPFFMILFRYKLSIYFPKH